MIFIIIILNFISILTYSTEKKIQPKPKEISIECNNQGYPKTDALKALITTKYLRQIKQEQIAVKEVSGGYFTEKMYVITTKKNNKIIPLLFFKISKKFDSAKKLIKLQEGKIGQTFMEYGHTRTISTGQTKKDLPIIIWLEDLFSYKNQKGETKTIEVTTAAKGETLEDILNSQNLQTITEAASCLGKSLAAFHQIYLDYDKQDTKTTWKTVCHGDFSIKNTLYDASLKKIYFIDNETMHEGSIAQDIRTILISVLMFRHLQKHTKTRWPLYLKYCETFLNAYINSYPVHLRKELAIFIEKTLDTGLHKVLYEKVVKNSNINSKKFKVKEFKKTITKCLNNFK